MAEEPETSSHADERYLRWQERTQQQLGFLNNVLLILGAGLIGFALNTGAASQGLAGGGWRNVAAGIAVIFVALSLAVGLAMAANRLRSLRMTTAMARVDYLRAELRGAYLEPVVQRRLDDLDRNYKRWGNSHYLSISPRARNLRAGAKQARSEIKEVQESKTATPAELKPLSDTLEEKAGVPAEIWSRAVDVLSWLALWLQLGLFSSGALLLAAIPIWNYLTK